MKDTSKRFLLLFLGFALSALVGCSDGQLTNDFAIENADGSGILGGVEVGPDATEAHHLAMLVDLETNQICTASLVRRRVLLTAAHCIPSKVELMSVFFDPNPLGEGSSVTPASVQRAVVHPRYTKKADSSSVDLALVFLDEPAPASFKEVRLSAGLSLAIKTPIDLSGFGKSSLSDPNSFGRLRRAQTEILNVTEGFFEIDQSAGTGICDGDSGGAAFVEDVEGLTLVGVTKMAYDKYTLGEDTCLGVSQFTRVDKNLSWILENL